MTESGQAIGIFDSGVGGLTVAAAISALLPNEDIIYLGDTARLPYGSKSKETIIRYAEHAASFLLKKQIKALVIACNTATAAALDFLREMALVPVIGVIEPGALAAAATGKKVIGVIGTNATIKSRAYETAIRRLVPDAQIISAACPLLVPLAEENFAAHPATRLILETYLAPFISAKVETLVLGCTHYPLLRTAVQEVVGQNVILVDSAATAASYLHDILQEKELLSAKESAGKLTFFATDTNERFSQIAKNFFGEHFTSLTQVDL